MQPEKLDAVFLCVLLRMLKAKSEILFTYIIEELEMKHQHFVCFSTDHD